MATSAGNSSLTQRMLGSVIKANFTQGPVSYRLASVAASHSSKLSSHLAQYTPNLLKLVATHPSALVEEFLDIVPHLGTEPDLILEVLHCLLDLPTLSASICVHQTALLVQAGFKVQGLVSVRQEVEAEHKQVYDHMMRSTAEPGQTEALIKLYPGYYSVLRPVLSLGLVEVCSQVVPLLLEAFLESVSGSVDTNRLLLPALLTRVPLLCPLPTYQKAIFDVLPQYISKVTCLQPELVESGCVVQFLSVTSHTQLCPQLFDTILSAVGEHARMELVTESFFETLDAVLREMLLDITTQDKKLVSSVCTTLAKLASRHVSLIPRAIATFEKLGQILQTSSSEQKESVTQHARELIRILKNPRVAGVVLSPSSKEDISVAALMRVLFQFLE